MVKKLMVEDEMESTLLWFHDLLNRLDRMFSQPVLQRLTLHLAQAS